MFEALQKQHDKTYAEFEREVQNGGWIGWSFDALKNSAFSGTENSPNIVSRLVSQVIDHDRGSNATREALKREQAQIDELKRGAVSSDFDVSATALGSEARLNNYQSSQQSGIDFVSDGLALAGSLAITSNPGLGLASGMLRFAAGNALLTGLGKSGLKYITGDSRDVGHDFITGAGVGALSVPAELAGGLISKNLASSALGSKLGMTTLTGTNLLENRISTAGLPWGMEWVGKKAVASAAKSGIAGSVYGMGMPIVHGVDEVRQGHGFDFGSVATQSLIGIPAGLFMGTGFGFISKERALANPQSPSKAPAETFDSQRLVKSLVNQEPEMYESRLRISNNRMESTKKVVVEESEQSYERTFRVGSDESYVLAGRVGGWFAPLIDKGEVGPVKVHVMTYGPEDLGGLQLEMIPLLSKDPYLAQRVSFWKTMDPLYGIGGEGVGPAPTGIGQRAKAFTIYCKNAQDALHIQEHLDKALSDRGLALAQPVKSGNVDSVGKLSNRVGIVCDRYEPAMGPDGKFMNDRVKIAEPLVKYLKGRFGLPADQLLQDAHLRQIEKEAGIREGTLTSGFAGNPNELVMRTYGRSHLLQNGKTSYYLDESRASKVPGDLTDRPAYYALARRYLPEGSDPVSLVQGKVSHGLIYSYGNVSGPEAV